MNRDSSVRILDPRDVRDATEIARLRSEDYFFVDTYDEQLKELKEIQDPESVGGTHKDLADEPGERVVVYPWRKTLVRIVGPEAYYELRTNRNRDLLTQEEQKRFAAARIGFAGLNVGNPGAVCVALEGGSHATKLADLDTLSVTNLNRFRAGLPDLGVNKATLTARQILEVDPYYAIELYDQGLAPDTIGAFLEGLDLLVDEMDALSLKIAVREAAKSLKIPVIMVTGNGEGILLDVERYDTDPDLPILNGLMEPRVFNAIMHPSGSLTPREKVALARDFMGAKYLDPRLVDSFSRFGSDLIGIPQLAESSFMRGAALCYAAKAIILGRPLPSSRYAFSFTDKMQIARQ